MAGVAGGGEGLEGGRWGCGGRWGGGGEGGEAGIGGAKPPPPRRASAPPPPAAGEGAPARSRRARAEPFLCEPLRWTPLRTGREMVGMGGAPGGRRKKVLLYRGPRARLGLTKAAHARREWRVSACDSGVYTI